MMRSFHFLCLLALLIVAIPAMTSIFGEGASGNTARPSESPGTGRHGTEAGKTSPASPPAGAGSEALPGLPPAPGHREDPLTDNSSIFSSSHPRPAAFAKIPKNPEDIPPRPWAGLIVDLDPSDPLFVHIPEGALDSLAAETMGPEMVSETPGSGPPPFGSPRAAAAADADFRLRQLYGEQAWHRHHIQAHHLMQSHRGSTGPQSAPR